LGNAALQQLTTGTLNTAVGSFAGGSVDTGSFNIFLGAYAGDNSPNSTSNTLVAGSDSAPINYGYLGNGQVNTSPTTFFALGVTGGSGSNVVGTELRLCGGISTGTGVGGSVVIQTSPAGTSGSTPNTLATRLTVDQKGNVVVGSGALAASATDGFLYIPTVSGGGTPSGTPTAFTGRQPMIWDATNNTLYLYNGFNWVSVVLS
jgi:hypothetical protein